MIHTMETLAREYNCEVIISDGFWRGDTATKEMFDRDDWLFLKRIAQAGLGNDSKLADVRVGNKKLNCMHRTQPRRNFSVFYRRIDTSTIMVIGIGKHGSSNKKYKVDWCDGRKNRIDIDDKNESGVEYLPNPIGGKYSFTTMDSVINKNFLEL